MRELFLKYLNHRWTRHEPASPQVRTGPSVSSRGSERLLSGLVSFLLAPFFSAFLSVVMGLVFSLASAVKSLDFTHSLSFHPLPLTVLGDFIASFSLLTPVTWKLQLLLSWALFFSSFLFFWPYRAARRILVPRPGMEPMLPAVYVQILNHWTVREVPWALFLKES